MSEKQDKTWLTALWDDGAFEREDAVDADEALRRLRAVNQELLEACLAMIEWDDRENDHAVDFQERMELCELAFQKARAAIEALSSAAEYNVETLAESVSQ